MGAGGAKTAILVTVLLLFVLTFGLALLSASRRRKRPTESAEARMRALLGLDPASMIPTAVPLHRGATRAAETEASEPLGEAAGVAAGDVAAGGVAAGDVAAGDVAAGGVAAGGVAAGDVAAGDVAAAVPEPDPEHASGPVRADRGEPAGAAPARGAADPGSSAGSDAAAAVAATAAAAPGWYADPDHRFRHRYWDGSFWTGWVSNGGETLSDGPSAASRRSEPDQPGLAAPDTAGA